MLNLEELPLSACFLTLILNKITLHYVPQRYYITIYLKDNIITCLFRFLWPEIKAYSDSRI